MVRADRRKYHYIYKTVRHDGKYYIGLHSTDNLDDGYLGSGVKLWKSIKRHGKEKHIREILEFLPSREALKERERELVNEEMLNDPMCMNLALGGYGGCGKPLSEEHKQKVSLALKGKKKPEGFGDKVSATLTGRPLSEEHKAACSRGHMGKKLSKEHVAKVIATRMANAKPQSEEQRKETSERMKGKPNISGVKLKKQCTVDGITIYPSMEDFIKALGNGKNGRKHPNFRFIT